MADPPKDHHAQRQDVQLLGGLPYCGVRTPRPASAGRNPSREKVKTRSPEAPPGCRELDQGTYQSPASLHVRVAGHLAGVLHQPPEAPARSPPVPGAQPHPPGAGQCPGSVTYIPTWCRVLRRPPKEQNFCRLKRSPSSTAHSIRRLQQAVDIGYLRDNPAEHCVRRVCGKPIKPLDDDAIRQFMVAAKGHRFERLYLLTLFTGLRQGEVLGLTWDCVDFAKGTC